MSADPSVSADSQVRRRIVSAPRRTLSPVALITRDPQGVSALVEKLKLARPVVTFPSLAHFCTDRQRAERWAGIIIGQACAWDARLDAYVVDRDCIALYGEEEGYGWPDAVYRLRNGDLDTWMAQLDAPRERVPVVRTREKRAPREGGEPRAKRSRSVFSLWSPDRVVSVEAGGASEAASQASATTQPGPQQASKAQSKVTVFREPKKSRPEQQTLPFVDAQANKGSKKPSKAPPPVVSASERRAEQARAKAEAAQQAMRQAAEREVAAWSQRVQSPRHRAAMSRAEQELMRLAAEIGFVNARNLLNRLRSRALEAVR